MLNGLEDYQRLVDGNIELLPTTRDAKVTCYVNEDGMLQELPINPWAPFLKTQGAYVRTGTPIFGNVVVLGEETEDGEDTSIDSSIVKKAASFF